MCVCMFVCMYVGVSYLGRTLPPATSLLAAAEVPLKRASSSAMGSSARNVLALQSITFYNTYIPFSTRYSYHWDRVHIHTVHTWIGVYLHAWAYIYIHTNHIDFEALVLALEERLLILVLAHMLERRTFLGTDRNAHPLYRQD